MDAIRCLRKNPDLAKVIVAGSIVTGGLSGTTLVVPALEGEIWGQDMAKIGSRIEAARCFAQIALTPAFGRWSDRVPRKWAFIVVGLVVWLPIWPLLIFGWTQRALTGAAVMRIFSGVCGNDACYFALINDFTTPEERLVVMGVGAAIGTIVQWGPKLGAGILEKVTQREDWWRLTPLFGDVFWMVVFLVLASSITRSRAPPLPKIDEELAVEEGEEVSALESSRSSSGLGSDWEEATDEFSSGLDDDVHRAHSAPSASMLARADSSKATVPDGKGRESRVGFLSGLRRASSDLSFDGPGPPPRYTSSPPRATTGGIWNVNRSARRGTLRMTQTIMSVTEQPRKTIRRMTVAATNNGHVRDTIKLFCSTPSLLLLGLIFIITSLPEVSERAITPQFVFQAFSVLGAQGGGGVTKEDILLVSGYSLAVSAMIICTIAGVVGNHIGPLKFTRILVPFTAAGQLVPMLYMVQASLAFVALVCSLAPIAYVIDLPLQTLVSFAAPPDRVGEALSAVSVCKAIAPLFGNLAVAPLINLVGTDRLWLFYVFGASLTLLAWPLACLMDVHPASKTASRGASGGDA